MVFPKTDGAIKHPLQKVSPNSLACVLRSVVGGIVPGPMLVLKLRGVGIADIPLVVRFFNPVGAVDDTDGRRRSCGIRDVVGVLLRSRSSSIWDMPLIDDPCPVWLLSEDRGRRLSVVGLVE